MNDLEEMNETEPDEDQSEEEAEAEADEKEKIEDQIEYYESAKDEFNSTTGSVYDEVNILASYESNREDILKAIYGNGDASSPSSNSAMDYNNQIKELISGDSEFKDIEKIILDDEFFTGIETAFDDLDDKVIGNGEKPNTLIDAANTKPYGLYVQASLFKLAMEIDYAQGPNYILQASKSLHGQADKEIKKITDHWKKYEASEELLQKDDRYDETFDEAEDNADTSFGELLDKINSAIEIGENFSADQEIYNTLSTYNSKYMGTGPDGEFIAEEERKDFINQSFDKMQDMFTLLTDPYAIRDQIYMNEYVMGNFGIKKPFNLQQDSFSYDTKKAMYILYGHHTSGVNYGQFLLEVAAIILAFNLFNALVANPLSKLGWIGVMVTIAVAIGETVTDFTNFIERELR